MMRLNVGGQIFCTSMDTLMSCPDSYFVARFRKRELKAQDADHNDELDSLAMEEVSPEATGRFQDQTDASGAHFVDRDGERFRHVLNYLRCGTVHCSNDLNLVHELMEEADYFGLTGMEAQLKQCRTNLMHKEATSSASRPTTNLVATTGAPAAAGPVPTPALQSGSPRKKRKSLPPWQDTLARCNTWQFSTNEDF